MPIIEKEFYSKRSVIKLDLPFTIDGKTTSYAEVSSLYVEVLDTDTLIESEQLHSASEPKYLEGMSKQQVIDKYTQEKEAIIKNHNRELEVLNQIIDQLEGE